MKPLPKWVGILAALGALASGLTAMINEPSISAIIPADLATKIAAGCALIASFAHSLTGTGGKK